jgi:hypothetical protein
MVRALPGRALEAARGLVSEGRSWREGVFKSLKARADAAAQLLKPGTRLVFALFQLGFLAHHAFRKARKAFLWTRCTVSLYVSQVKSRKSFELQAALKPQARDA